MSDKKYSLGEYYQPLFENLQDQFGVLALVSEMAEIIEIVRKMEALHPSESAGASAVWMKGQYDQLYEQVKTGKRTVCYIDYHAHGVDKVYRDICTIRPDVLEFSSRGVGYGCAQYMDGDEKTNFIQFCEKMNVEWLRESPSLAPDQSGKEEAVAFAWWIFKQKYGRFTDGEFGSWSKDGKLLTTEELYDIYQSKVK